LKLKLIRKPGEDLKEMLAGLKVGDAPILDSVSGYEIVKVPNGYIYKNEFVGMCFVPEKVSDGEASRTTRMRTVEK
jgi:hypothetical protein